MEKDVAGRSPNGLSCAVHGQWKTMRGIEIGGGVQNEENRQGGGNMSEITLSAKKLGFGLMRLPKNGEAIDVEQVKKMVD
ncbi:hypothetical protein, partial [Pyramidobacter porci]